MVERGDYLSFTHHTLHPPAFINCTLTLSDSDPPLRFDIKDYLSNSIPDMDFGCPSSEDNNFDAYSFGGEQSLDSWNPYNLDLDVAITGQSGFHYWHLNPSTEGYVNQFEYRGCTLLGVSRDQFVDPYSLHTESPYERVDVGESWCCQS